MNVFSSVTPTEAGRSTGIGQAVWRLMKHLPEFGFTMVDEQAHADVYAVHAADAVYRVDVAHCHGLMPTGDFENPPLAWWEINRRVIDNLIKAEQVTVPSQWVADLLASEMGISAHVVRWGVDKTEWNPPDKHGNYVLWAKNRRDLICDPVPFEMLARDNPSVEFISTYAAAKYPNLRSYYERLPYEDMRHLLSQAAVLVATTRESGAIQVLEALAAGVPVLAYDWGATAEIITHQHDGYLVPAGSDLSEGLRYILAHRETMSIAAQQTAERYSWRTCASEMAAIYTMAAPKSAPLVSVVIPCHNYGKYIQQAIYSVASQTYPHIEIIVVDDASTDDSPSIIREATQGVRGCSIYLQQNVGVARARNIGIARAHGEYIVCLDADDALEMTFVEVCAAALNHNPKLGIAYTGLRLHGQTHAHHWPPPFDADAQLAGDNRIPSACMFRRKAWQRAGGYRHGFKKVEDADLWIRMASIGFAAEKVTEEPLFTYRVHEGSRSRTAGNDVDLRNYYPWQQGLPHPFASLSSTPRNSHPVRFP